MNLDTLATAEKIAYFKPVNFDIDPQRVANNFSNMCELKQQAMQEQIVLVDRLVDSLTN